MLNEVDVCFNKLKIAFIDYNIIFKPTNLHHIQFFY